MADTVYILGAGSTASLGMPTTDKQIKWFQEIDVGGVLGKLKSIVFDLFGKKSNGLPNCSMNDIYNLIDSNLLLHSGLYSGKQHIAFFELEKCKKELIAFLFEKFNEIIGKHAVDKSRYQRYVRFYTELAKKELDKKMRSSLAVNDRDFFISSYSIINFNWDLFSLLPIIEAHNELNHNNDRYMAIGRNPQLRIYTDFNCEYARAKEKEKLWYPFSEQAAFLINDPKYDASRRAILTRCFYPHGAMNFYKCSHCAKHSYYLGELNLASVTEKMRYSADSEIYKCPYCGDVISSMDFDVLVQSNFKTRNSFLEETRLSMINELRHAKRLVFIGYSMPKDDVDYITMFRSLNNVREVYVVLKEDCADNSFFEIESSSSYNPRNQEIIANFKEVFYNKRLLFNFSGAPDAFDSITQLPDV